MFQVHIPHMPQTPGACWREEQPLLCVNAPGAAQHGDRAVTMTWVALARVFLWRCVTNVTW